MLKKRNVHRYLAIAIAFIALLIYLPALRNGFVDWDDRVYVFQNSHIRSFDPAFLKWAFFDFYASNWHPITWISHAADYALWGLNPLGHHFTSIVLHAVNSLLAVLLVIKLLETVKQSASKKTRLFEFLSDRTILITGGVTGLLFGIHPVHVESVAWVSERKDLLCAFFFMLSIIMYTSYVRSMTGKATQQNPPPPFLNKHYLATALFFVLALLSKPMAVTLPVVLLILDGYPFQRIQSLKTLRPALVEKIPFFAFSLISSVLTVLAQKSGASLVASEIIPLSTRIFVAAQALIAYLGKMIWPLNLMPFYQYYRKGEFFGTLEYLAPIIAVIGLFAASVMAARKQKLWAAAWGYYVVTLIPVLGIVQVGSQLMADRYTYLPSLGLFMILGLFAAVVIDKVEAKKKKQPMTRIITATVAVVALVSLSYLTLTQIAIWKDTVSLWSRVIEKEPSTVAAYKERAEAYKKEGELDRALQDYDTAIALYPIDYDAHYNRGLIYNATGAFDKAAEDFSRYIFLYPNDAGAYHNRGFAYFSMGQYKNALEDFSMAIRLEPNNVHAYYNRGNLYAKTGQQVNARADFTKACGLGDEDGCRALRKAASIVPDVRNEFLEFIPPKVKDRR